jgi:hypothetical protein
MDEGKKKSSSSFSSSSSLSSSAVLWFTHDDYQMASILFLDSPVGSGFSYARDPKGYDVGDYSSSLQVQTFLNKVVTVTIVVDVPSCCSAGQSLALITYLLLLYICSGSLITRSIFQILSTLEEIHMLGW